MDLSELRTLSEADFELERQRLIELFLSSVPTDKRSDLIKLQKELDEIRAKCSRTEFCNELSTRMVECIENISDQFVFIKNMAYSAKTR